MNDGNTNSSSSIRFQFQPLKVWILSQNGFFLESNEHLKTTLKRFRPNFFKRMLVKLIHNFPKFSLKVSLFWKVSRTQRLLWSFFEPISSSRPHKVHFSQVNFNFESLSFKFSLKTFILSKAMWIQELLWSAFEQISWVKSRKTNSTEFDSKLWDRII